MALLIKTIANEAIPYAMAANKLHDSISNDLFEHPLCKRSEEQENKTVDYCTFFSRNEISTQLNHKPSIRIVIGNAFFFALINIIIFTLFIFAPFSQQERLALT